MRTPSYKFSGTITLDNAYFISHIFNALSTPPLAPGIKRTVTKNIENNSITVTISSKHQHDLQLVNTILGLALEKVRQEHSDLNIIGMDTQY